MQVEWAKIMATILRALLNAQDEASLTRALKWFLLAPQAFLREAFNETNLLFFGHCPKGGGVFGQSKLFEALFFMLMFGHFSRVGRVHPSPNFLRHFCA